MAACDDISERSLLPDDPHHVVVHLDPRDHRAQVRLAALDIGRVDLLLQELDLQDWRRRPADGEYRLEIDPESARAWILSPDFKRLVAVRRQVRDNYQALYRATFVPGDNRAHIERVGPGQAE